MARAVKNAKVVSAQREADVKAMKEAHRVACQKLLARNETAGGSSCQEDGKLTGKGSGKSLSDFPATPLMNAVTEKLQRRAAENDAEWKKVTTRANAPVAAASSEFLSALRRSSSSASSTVTACTDSGCTRPCRSIRSCSSACWRRRLTKRSGRRWSKRWKWMPLSRACPSKTQPISSYLLRNYVGISAI